MAWIGLTSEAFQFEKSSKNKTLNKKIKKKLKKNPGKYSKDQEIQGTHWKLSELKRGRYQETWWFKRITRFLTKNSVLFFP